MTTLTGTSRGVAAVPGARSIVAAVMAGLVVAAGLCVVAAWFGLLGWTWVLRLGVGFVGGIVAGRANRVWGAVIGTLAYFALTPMLKLPADTGPFAFIGVVLTTIGVALAFVLGSQLALRRSPVTAARASWSGSPRWVRIAGIAVLAVALVGLAGYNVYAAQTGSEEFMHFANRDPDCRTPDSLGWAYEAINYDKADDARLASANADRTKCASQGAAAGSEVVTPDGIRIAGWYVPAATAAAPTGPTLLIVHGWKTNKSGVLKYGVPLHGAYNLVFVDLRHNGRSTGDETTMGLREQADVRAMLDWLVRTKNPSWIGVVANSMGATTALAEAVDDPRVRAFVIDSAWAQITTTTRYGMEADFNTPALLGNWSIVTAMSAKTGGDLTAIDPIRTVTKLGNRPILFLHGAADRVDPPAESADLNYHAALAAGVRAELAYCQGAPHGKVIETCPTDWAGWATSFLARARANG